MTDPLKASRSTTAFRGGLLTVSMRWTDRLLGLVSTMILARLLVPEDFGLVAMAMVFAGLMDVLLDLGVAAALVQNTRADSDDFHTAWTLRLCQAAAAAVLIAVSAGSVGVFFDDARIVPILYVIAIAVLVGGLENIGIVSFQKNMEFGRDFKFFFVKRLLATSFTLVAAFVMQSYWALVLGMLVSRLAGVGISYSMSAFRPRLSLSRFAQIWSFSQWNMFSTIGQYLAGASSRLLVGRRSNADVLGTYSMGEEIALMPTTELLAPLGRVMLPVFAAAKHDSSELLRVVTLALSVQTLIAVPAGLGIALVAGDAILVLLGPKWLGAVPFVQIVAVASIATALAHSTVYMLTATGRMKAVATYNWSRAVLLLAMALVAFPSADAHGIALMFLVSSVGGLVVSSFLAKGVISDFGLFRMILSTWRPLVSAAVMAGVVTAVSGLLAGRSPLLRLLLEVSTGATVYLVVVWSTWRVTGSPAGAESYLLDKTGIARLLK